MDRIQTDGRTDGQADGWMDGRTDGQMDGWKDNAENICPSRGLKRDQQHADKFVL